MKRWYYTPDQIAPVVGWAAQYIRIMARRSPDKLPFPTELRLRIDEATGRPKGNSESRVRIPKKPFEEWFLSQGGDPDILQRLRGVA